MQGVDNLFEVDTVQNIMKHVSEIAGGELRRKREGGYFPAGHHRPYPHHHLYDGRRRRALQRGPRLRAAPPAAPGRPSRPPAGNSIDPFLYQVCETVIAGKRFRLSGAGRKERLYHKGASRWRKSASAKTIDQGMEILNSIMDKITADQIDRPCCPARMRSGCTIPLASPLI